MNNATDFFSVVCHPITVGGDIRSFQDFVHQLTKVGYIFIRLREIKDQTQIGIHIYESLLQLYKKQIDKKPEIMHVEGVSFFGSSYIWCVLDIDLNNLDGYGSFKPISPYEKETWPSSIRESNLTPSFSWGINRIFKRTLPLDGQYIKPQDDGLGANVYLLDTGIDYNHPSLRNQAHHGYDAFGGNGLDEVGNGTFLAGVISTIAPKSQLYSVKILNREGKGTIEGIMDAVEWLTKNAQKPAVVNVSIGIPPNDDIDNAIRESINAGITYVIEGGGISKNVEEFSPSRIREGIVVGATDYYDRKAEFSNYGRGVDIFAPGVDIISIAPENKFAIMSGVQVAAAHVTGVVALYMGQNLKLSPKQIKQRIIQNAVEGIINSLPEDTPNRLLHFDVYQKA